MGKQSRAPSIPGGNSTYLKQMSTATPSDTHHSHADEDEQCDQTNPFSALGDSGVSGSKGSGAYSEEKLKLSIIEADQGWVVEGGKGGGDALDKSALEALQGWADEDFDEDDAINGEEEDAYLDEHRELHGSSNSNNNGDVAGGLVARAPGPRYTNNLRASHESRQSRRSSGGGGGGGGQQENNHDGPPSVVSTGVSVATSADDSGSQQVNPFGALGNDSYAYRGGGGGASGWYDNDEEVDDARDCVLYGIAEDSYHEQHGDGPLALGDVESNNRGTRRDNNGVLPPEGANKKSSTPRKKVKHRHCKAAIMICFIWGITIILISIALGMDWGGINETFGRSADCTLCGDNGLDFNLNLNETGNTGPTRQPSSYNNETTLPLSSSSSKIDPPPVDLSKVCAPSIHLQPNSEDLLQSCIKACLPAVCCLVNNDQAKGGLLSMLGLPQEMGNDTDNQASLSNMQDCYSGNDVPVCDAYNEWCATLYDLDHVLEESLPSHFFDTCYRNQNQEHNNGDGGNDAIVVASSRSAFNPATAAADDNDGDDCREMLCSPLACCYNEKNGTNEDETNVNNHVAVERNRNRHHKHHDNVVGSSGEGNNNFITGLRRLRTRHDSAAAEQQTRSSINLVFSVEEEEEDECQHFSAQEASMNAQTKICDAYAPFCNPLEHSWDSDLVLNPSSLESGAPSQSMQPSLKQPSAQSSSSDHPSMSLGPTWDNDTMANVVSSSSSPTSSFIPSSMPSQTIRSVSPSSNENTDLRLSFKPSTTTNFPSVTRPSESGSNTNTRSIPPTASLYPTVDNSLKSPTSQVPSSSEMPTTVESRNITTLNSTSASNSYQQQSTSPSTQPSYVISPPPSSQQVSSVKEEPPTKEEESNTDKVSLQFVIND